MEELENLLKSHDWFYDYSDDSRVWRRGESERMRIEQLMKKLASESPEQKEKVKKLWTEIVPKSENGNPKFFCPI